MQTDLSFRQGKRSFAQEALRDIAIFHPKSLFQMGTGLSQVVDFQFGPGIKVLRKKQRKRADSLLQLSPDFLK